jgi:hypothetical protein
MVPPIVVATGPWSPPSERPIVPFKTLRALSFIVDLALVGLQLSDFSQ